MTAPAPGRGRRWLRRILVFGIATAIVGLVGFAILDHCFPFPFERLEHWPVSPTIQDREGRVVLTAVGSDDQWRYPVALSDMGEWLPRAIVAVEDERFRLHGGVDPLSVLRAAGQNLGAGRVVSGASTLTMQVARMTRDRPRTLPAKLLESFRAFQLEQRYHKNEILELYLNIAPMGGNLRGVEAAARRYFGKASQDLTLAESALIAGLPQSPTRLRPDRHLEGAITRQRFVLGRMLDERVITDDQYRRAMAEPIEIRRFDLPRVPELSHGSWWALGRRAEGGRTTFDLTLQSIVESCTQRWGSTLAPGTDLAVVVIHVPTAELRAMVGSIDATDPLDGQVNGAVRPRSPGSTLKPFIYGVAFDQELLAPSSPIDDRAIERGGWRPANFDQRFRGRVTAADALRSSLNIPAILVAEATGLPECVDAIRRTGIRLPDGVVERSGLSLATGGTEVTLLDLTRGYATIARGGVDRPVTVWLDEPKTGATPRALSERTCGELDDILGSHRRTPRGYDDRPVTQRPWFAWKTGTSSRRRDAWAIGHNHEWAIGVWVGSFSGSGHETYVGAEVAEPLLAQLFALPAIASSEVPPPPPDRAARNLVDLTGERARADVGILEPENGATFITAHGPVRLQPRARADGGIQWFLNGKLVDFDVHLEVGPGQHELRAVAENGASDAVRFSVR